MVNQPTYKRQRFLLSFVRQINNSAIRLLCDVRKNPLSRKFGYSKSKPKHITQTVGISNIHIPELGIESDKRCFLTTPEDYRNLFTDYEKTLPDKQPYLDEVFVLLQQNTRIALMCFELKPDMCHRHVIRDYIVRTRHIKSVDM